MAMVQFRKLLMLPTTTSLVILQMHFSLSSFEATLKITVWRGEAINLNWSWNEKYLTLQPELPQTCLILLGGGCSKHGYLLGWPPPTLNYSRQKFPWCPPCQINFPLKCKRKLWPNLYIHVCYLYCGFI